MADFDNEIDEIFKSRFDGLKDSNIDPVVHWPAVEKGLAQSVDIAIGSSGSGFVLISKIAAVISVGLFVAGISGDSINRTDELITASNDLNQAAKVNVITNESPVKNYELNSQGSPSTRQQNVLASSSLDDQLVKAMSQDKSSLKTTIEAEHSYAVTSDLTDGLVSTSTSTKDGRDDFLNHMESLPIYSYSQPIISNPNEIPDPNIDRWDDNHVWFFRGGARIGNGESNSYAMNSEWKVNPTFSFGYGFSLTDQSFISAEIGLLRRSGNAIERMRQRIVDPVVASFANTANKESSFEIHNGLIAYQMDYIHMPIMYNRVFLKNWTASIGGFADYLIAAKNHSMIVYNGHEYVENVAKSDEIRSLAGLSKVRYGAVAGIERNLTQHFSTFAQVMVPINNAVDPKSGFEVFGNSNRLVDSKVGLKYNF